MKTGPRGSGRVRNGAVMRVGVCCHRGRSAASVSYSGARVRVVVENAHAEVSMKHLLRGGVALTAEPVQDITLRKDRFDAIGSR